MFVHALNCLDRNQLAEVSSLIFVDPSAFAHESCIKGAVHVRGGVLKSTLVVDNDTTVHDVHTYTVAFSPSVLIKCSICSQHQTLMRMNGSRNDTRHMTHGHIVSSWWRGDWWRPVSAKFGRSLLDSLFVWRWTAGMQSFQL